MGRTTIYRIIGGILGLFREVVSEALDYMNAHSEHLEKKLTESQTAKAGFLNKTASLEKEIARLLEQVEKLPEDTNEEE
ncbi:hypothetical protein [Okeania sp. SIO3B5]|uniref:hypothetical protein n=1 Tax=Okeania sp. SIO3B5 TaxID=2607811 RepID=UPI0025E6168F|nr:hypothetical protein [Okeania sp. SIO3B5]